METPEWALPLCPWCGAWGQGEAVEIVGLRCRVAAAFVMSRGVTRAEMIDTLNANRGRRGEAALPEGWPEPIDWQRAASLEDAIEERREWVKRVAAEEVARD